MTHIATQKTCYAESGFLSSYVYIGDFFIHSGAITLCDPLANDVFFDSANMIPPEERPVQIDIIGCCNGRYMAYYQLRDGEPSSLLLFHVETTLRECKIPSLVKERREKNNPFGILSFPGKDTCMFFTGRGKMEKRFSHSHIVSPCGRTVNTILRRLEHLLKNHATDNGTISVLLGRTLCVVESEYAFQPEMSLYEIEPDAIYDASSLLSLLHKAPYEPSLKIALKNYLEQCIDSGRYAQGSMLFSIVEGSSICWDGYRRVPGTHWGCDIIGRVHRETALVPGGVALDYEKNSFIQIFSLTDIAGRTFAIQAIL